MAKIINYHCKDCKENNNGWCTILKMNGLKEITQEMCEAAGGNKVSKFGVVTPVATKQVIALVDEDDMIEKAKNEVLGKPVSERQQEILELLGELRLDSDTREGETPGSVIVTVTLYHEDTPITDTDFYVQR